LGAALLGRATDERAAYGQRCNGFGIGACSCARARRCLRPMATKKIKPTLFLRTVLQMLHSLMQTMSSPIVYGIYLHCDHRQNKPPFLCCRHGSLPSHVSKRCWGHVGPGWGQSVLADAILSPRRLVSEELVRDCRSLSRGTGQTLTFATVTKGDGVRDLLTISHKTIPSKTSPAVRAPPKSSKANSSRTCLSKAGCQHLQQAATFRDSWNRRRFNTVDFFVNVASSCGRFF